MTNRIIIPVVGSRQNLEEQNVFKHVNLNLTPQKGPQPCQSILWKRSSSAFKKFKDKRERGSRKEEVGGGQMEEQPSNCKKTVFKLSQQRGRFPLSSRYPQLLQNQDFLLFLTDPNNKYFDPNEAPLFVSGDPESLLTLCQFDLRGIASQPVGAVVRVEERMRQQSEAGEQEYPLVMGIEPLPDDPFIIIRKTSSRRSGKAHKCKPIKKEKLEKVRSRDSFNEQPEPGREKVLQLKRQSFESEESPDRFQKSNRQIITLQQIKSAHERHIEEQRRVKFKEGTEPLIDEKQESPKLEDPVKQEDDC